MRTTELLARVCGPLVSPNLNTCYFCLWGKLTNIVYANNTYDLEALKENIRGAVYNIQQHELQQVLKICLKEFRHVSQKRGDISYIYDGKYNINCYI
jgi:hypothetical protein